MNPKFFLMLYVVLGVSTGAGMARADDDCVNSQDGRNYCQENKMRKCSTYRERCNSEGMAAQDECRSKGTEMAIETMRVAGAARAIGACAISAPLTGGGQTCQVADVRDNVVTDACKAARNQAVGDCMKNNPPPANCEN